MEKGVSFLVLDIDGVIKDEINPDRIIHLEAGKRLKQIIDATGAKVLISSTWKPHFIRQRKESIVAELASFGITFEALTPWHFDSNNLMPFYSRNARGKMTEFKMEDDMLDFPYGRAGEVLRAMHYWEKINDIKIQTWCALDDEISFFVEADFDEHLDDLDKALLPAFRNNVVITPTPIADERLAQGPPDAVFEDYMFLDDENVEQCINVLRGGLAGNDTHLKKCLGRLATDRPDLLADRKKNRAEWSDLQVLKSSSKSPGS